MCMEPASQIWPPVPEELSESLSTVPLGLWVEPSCVNYLKKSGRSLQCREFAALEDMEDQPIDNTDKNLSMVAMLKTTGVTI